MVDLQKDQFIKGGPFIEAYRANLDEDIKKHLAEGKPYSTFVVDNNDLIKRSMADTRYDIYDPTAINKKLRELYPNRVSTQTPVPGKTTGITTASPFYKTDPKTGLATKELDFDIIAEAFSQPSFRDPVNQMFAMQLAKADSPYFIENTKLKQQFANDPDAYAAAQEKLKADFVRKDMPKLTYLTSDALLREPSSVATSRPSGGRGKQKEVVTGEGVFTNIKGMGGSSNPAKTEVSQTILTYPVVTTSSGKGANKSVRIPAPSTNTINIGENQVVKYKKIPEQSEVDIANADYTALPMLTKDITIDNFIDRDGKLVKKQVFKRGTVIGQGDQFSERNRDFIKKIVELANRNNGVEITFGALIPTYTRQSKALTKEEQLAAQLEAKITGEPIEDIQRAYGAQKLGLYQGEYFFPRDFSKGSIFSKAWGASRNLYKDMTLEQIERSLKGQSKEMTNKQLGITPKSSLDFFKKAPQQNTGASKATVKMEGY
jgi:hypothetical protein